MDKILKPFLPKKGSMPNLHTILRTDKKTVATDSFKLIEIDNELAGIKDEMITCAILQRNRELYPKYETIIPNEQKLKKEYITVNINTKYLAEALTALSDLQKKCNLETNMLGEKIDPSCQIYIPHDEHKPVVIKIKQATVLVMPQIK